MKRTIKPNSQGRYSVTVSTPQCTKSCKGLPSREAAERLADRYEQEIAKGV